MHKNRQLLINMISQMVAFGVNLAISFFLTPYIVKNVGVDAYGFVGLANNFISYITIITTALNSMAGRFITIEIHKGNANEANKYFTSVFIANAAISCVLIPLSVLMISNMEYMVEIPSYIRWDVKMLTAFLIASFLLSLIGNVYSIATFSQNRLDLAAIRGIESNLLKATILLVTFSFFRPAVWYLGFATFVCGAYVFVTNLYYTKKLLPDIKIEKRYYDFGKIKELIASGMWNSITRISGILATGLDLLITNLFVGAVPMGMVSVISTVPTYILSAFGAISGVFMPQLTIDYAKGRPDEIKKQLLSTVRLTGFLASVPVACLYVYGIDFYRLWLPGQDAGILQLLTILRAVALPFSLVMEPIWNVFTVSNRVKQSSIFLMISSVITVILTFILLALAKDDITKMCIIVGVSTFMGIIKSLFFLPIMGARCVGAAWHTFYPDILKNISTLAVVILFSLFMRHVLDIASWLEFILAILITSVIAIIINYNIMLTKNEKGFIKKKLRFNK